MDFEERLRMNKTIGVLAHVDAGKTTFSEQILYHVNKIRKRGRVDHQDTFLDTHALEKRRGITIFSDQAEFSFRGNTYFWVDTPGHVDFSSEMERAVEIMDYAVLLISAVEGVQSHTQTVWSLLERYRVPVFVFINKTDRAGADVQRVLTDSQTRLSSSLCFFTGGGQAAEMSPAFAEQIASMDELLLEAYLEQGFDAGLWQDRMVHMIQNRTLFPCFCGSALLDQGISEFLDALDRLTATDYAAHQNDPFEALVYKVRHDAKNNRISFFKVLRGELYTKETVATGEQTAEKINELRRYSGEKYEQTAHCSCGELCAATGILNAKPGSGIGAQIYSTPFETTPLLQAKVLYPATLPAQTMLGHFRLLEEEDPLLKVLWEEETHEIRISVMGLIQLEVLQELVLERFGISVSFGPCQVLYRETILSPVVGYGHFEPLRHYAEVHLKLSPAPRGTGITFDSDCPTDELEQQYQNLIRTHVMEKEHRGILTGSPVCDVTVTLLTGRAHLKHTQGGDFREATYRAVRQALEQAENLLLEPFYSFVIEISPEDLGRAISEIQKRMGRFQPPETVGSLCTIRGRGPVATFMDYARFLASETRGTGRFQIHFGGYEPCHNPDEVIRQKNYQKDRDSANPSSSVFCSHGTGFTVKWEDAKKYMHCK